MKPNCSREKRQALTLVEVLVIVAMLGILSVMLFSTLRNRSKPWVVYCVYNLKQIGLAYHVWAEDHYHEYPSGASITNGGFSQNIPASRALFLNFLTLSNELSTPKLLHCPADFEHPMANDFGSDFSNTNISYFANLDATEGDPQGCLSGDDNLMVDGQPAKSGLLKFSTHSIVTWTKERHHSGGNVGLADGSAQQLNSFELQQAFQQGGVSTNRLVIP